MQSALDELIGRLDTLPESEREATTKAAIGVTGLPKWKPIPGPQTDAYFCAADVLLYGGQAAGGKSDLIAGLALVEHKRSLIMRRQYTDLGAMIERVREIDGTYDGFNGAPPPRLRTADGRLIDFGAAAKLGDERHWQGQPHDFLGIDEAVHWLEAQVRFLMGWVRSTEKGQRTRTVFATNPPDSATTRSPVTPQAGTALEKPFKLCRPRSVSSKAVPTRRRVADPMTTWPTSATACRRAARFGVSPVTACASDAVSPTRSPTTT